MLAQINWFPILPQRHLPVRASSSPALSAHSDSRSIQDSSKGENRRWDNADVENYQVDLSTGFPVPIGYRRRPEEQQHWLSWREQRMRNLAARPQAADTARTAAWAEREPDHDAEVWPVYRASPYRAELARQAEASTATRILFVDEGQQCRAVLAEAILSDMLRAWGRNLDVTVASASVGPAPPGDHDERVMAAAEQARVQLRPRKARVFDEVVDIVNFDLVLVLDHFDLTEVVKEVAVLDNINPGGFYAARVKLLGRFAPKAAAFAGPPSLGAEDIPDPFYGNTGGQTELMRLRKTVQQIRAASKGLLRHLLDLQKRCTGGMTLSKALMQSLQCPLLSASAACAIAPRLHRRRAHRPVWREDDISGANSGLPGKAKSGNTSFYTIRTVNGQQRVVRRPSGRGKGGVKSSYWKDLANVDAELQAFMRRHGIKGRVPSSTEMREAGAFSLYQAVCRLGGVLRFAERLGLQKNRRDNHYWDNFENVRREIEAVLRDSSNAGTVSDVDSASEADLVSDDSAAPSSDVAGAAHMSHASADADEHADMAPHHSASPTPYKSATPGEARHAEGHSPLSFLLTAASEQSSSGQKPSNTNLVEAAGSCIQDGEAASRDLSIPQNAAEGLESSGVDEESQLPVLEMPSARELQARCGQGIMRAIQALGGRQAVAQRLGLRCTPLSQEVRLRSLGELSQELRAALPSVLQFGLMPNKEQLLEAGRSDLLQAIRRMGGFKQVAAALDLVYLPVPKSQLQTLGDLSLELEAAAPYVLQYGVMPNRAQLLEAGRPDLARAVKRLGGFKRVAAALDLVFLPVPKGRARAAAWSPEKLHSPLALVQFSRGIGASSPRQVSITPTGVALPETLGNPGQPTSARPGQVEAAGDGHMPEQHRHESHSSNREGTLSRRRAKLLSAEQEARAAADGDAYGADIHSSAEDHSNCSSRSSSSRARSPDSAAGRSLRHMSAGPDSRRGNGCYAIPEPTEEPALLAARSRSRQESAREAPSEPPGRSISLGSRARSALGSPSRAAQATTQIPMGRPSFTIGIHSTAAPKSGGSVRQADAKRGDLVAPLLREVAAEVERFVASGGWTRMPTRPELMSAGRPDLANAVVRVGGVAAMARHLGLPFKETRGRKPRASDS